MTARQTSDEPWGEQLRRWREETKHWTQEDLVEQVVTLAFQDKDEVRGTKLTIEVLGRWERGEVKRPQAIYRRLLGQLGAPLPTTSARRVTSTTPRPSAALDLGATSPQPPAQQILLPGPPQLLGKGYDYGDSEYLESVRGYIGSLVSLDNRFGGDDLVRVATRFFGGVHNLIGSGAYDQRLESDLNAAAGELAEVVGWLAYDAEQHDLVRRMNQESLYFSRLAGDRTIELLTLQNSSMHALAMGRPGEALQLARSVLEGNGTLSPRVRALFLTRKARALAQMGDERALSTFREIEALHLDGVSNGDPAWAWWVDERELAWHEAMAGRDLRKLDALDEFEHSVEATAPTETRSQYLHRAYLLQAQVDAGSWSNIATTIETIIPLVHQVASTRTVVILRSVIEKSASLSTVPDGVHDSLSRLSATLDASAV